MNIRRAIGTWESQIIKALCEYLKNSRQQDKLKIVAFIANASILIDGPTIYSLIGLSTYSNMD
jgi:hypothetical protein